MKNAISVKYTLLCGTACCMASAVQAQRNVSDVSRMNVLFLMADDMRPELGCYGVEAVKTPNMDRLASSRSLVSERLLQCSGEWRFPCQPSDRRISSLSRSFCEFLGLCQQGLSGGYTSFRMVHKEWLSYSFGWQSFSPHERSCRIVERTSLPESSGWIRCLLGGI